MTESKQTNPMATLRVRYKMQGTEAVRVRRDVPFPGATGERLLLDIYLPPEARTPGAPPPCLVIVAGYPDEGFERIMGVRFKETGSSQSWAELIAASGMAAVVYTNRDPVTDVRALLTHLQTAASDLGIDPMRLGLWASSGNVPVALSLLMDRGLPPFACAALCYGLTLDLDGHTEIADAARQFRFRNPSEGKSVDDLPRNTPLYLLRAGQDQMPGLNASMDRLIARALALNLPVTIANYPDGVHAFDLTQEGPATGRVVGSLLAFLKAHMVAAAL